MSRKGTIAVDIDNVLADTAESFAEYSNRNWGTQIVPTDFNEDFATLWGVPHTEALRRLNQIYETDIFLSIAPKKGALETLQHLQKDYRIVALTSRRKSIAADSQTWLDRYYGGIVEELYFSGIYDKDLDDPSLLSCTKGEVLVDIGASFLIDDEPKHCLSAADNGVKSILFQTRAQVPNPQPPLLICINTWHEVKQYFDAN